MMKDGTYKVKIDKDGLPSLSETVLMSSGYWVADESGVSVHGGLDKNGLLSALSLMDVVDGETIGIWENESISYIDRAYHIDDVTEAMEIARTNNQLAIWDCARSEAIHL
jgi:hypothetical protein